MANKMLGMAGRSFGGASGNFYVVGALIDMISPGLRNISKQVMVTQGQFMRGAMKWEQASWLVTKSMGALNTISIATLAATAGMGLAYAGVAKQAIEFERTLVNMNSILAESKEVMWGIGREVVELSKRYNKSADEIASGSYHLASAGLKANEIMGVLTPTLQLAVATQGDFTKISKDVVQTIKGFGMEMSKAQHVADIMVYTIQHSLVTWDKLGEGIKFAMPWFAAAGLTFEELAAAVGLLSDRALEAGIGGRGLRQSLAMLIREVSEGKDKFSEMGISVADAEGNMLPLLDIVKQFRAAYPEMNVEAIAAMMELLGIRGATAFSHLVVGMEEYEEKLNSLSKASGTAARVAEEQMSSIGAQLQILKNQFLAPFKTREFADSVRLILEEIKPLILEFTPMVAAMMLNIGHMFKTIFEKLDFSGFINKVMLVAGILLDVFSSLSPELLKLAAGFLLIAKMGRLNALAMNLQEVAALKLSIGMQRDIMLNQAMVLGVNKTQLARQMGIGTTELENVVIQKMIATEQAQLVAQSASTVAKQKDTVATQTSTVVDQTSAMYKRQAGIATAVQTVQTKKNTIATVTSARQEQIATMVRANHTIGTQKLQGMEEVLGVTTLQNAGYTNTLSLAQMNAQKVQVGLNLSLSAATFAMMAYMEGMIWLGNILAAATGLLVAYAVARAMAKDAELGTAGLIAAGVAGTAAAATVYGIGQWLAAKAAKQKAEFATMRSEMETSMAGARSGQSAGVPSTAIAQEGGTVEEGGWAYVHKEEHIIPGEEFMGGGIYIDLRNSVVTNEAAESLAKHIKKEVILSIYDKQRMRR